MLHTEALVEALGGKKVDVLLHNAGILVPESLDALDVGQMRRQYETNAIAPLALTKTLASKMKLSELAARAAEVLVRFNRMNDIGPVLDAMASYVNEALGIARVEVRSAKNLSPDEMQQLATTLSRKVGKKVELDVTTDPALLGGFVAKIGSEVWDASVAGKINRFKETLT